MTEQQKMQRDSLELYFKIADDNYVPYQQRLDNTEKALAIVQQQEKDTMYRVNLFKVANRYWNIQELEKYKEISDNLLSDALKEKDTFNLAKSYSYLGDYYMEKSISDSSYFYFSKSEILSKKINDINQQFKTLRSKAVLLYTQKDFIGSEKLLFDCLKLSNKLDFKNQNFICDIYSLLGIIYCDLYEFDKAIFYHNKALEFIGTLTLMDKSIQKSAVYNNIGLVYAKNEDYTKAVEFFKKALDVNVLIKNNTLRNLTINCNLSYYQFKLSDSKLFPKLFFENYRIINSLNKSKNLQTSKNETLILLGLSEYYAFKKDSIRAIDFANKSFNIAKSIKYPIRMLMDLKQLLIIDPKNASKYASEYIKINDSLQLAERKNRNKFARIEYETEELEIEKANLQTQRIYIVYTAVALLLLLIAIIIIRYQRSKNRELQYNQQQQKANSEIYRLMLDQQQKIEEGKQIEKKRISKELHDGVMGRLTSIRLNLFILSKKTDKETIDKCLHHISEIQNIEKEIRNIAYDLGINIFSDNINFETVVRNLFAEIESHSEIQFILKTDEQIDWEAVHINIKMQIYRVLQEALQNIDKYAQAKNVIINMRKVGSDINVIITDDGIGFEKSKIKKGFGLNNMKDRIKTINGKITIRSAVGEGTTINVIVPVPEDYFVAV